MYLSRAQYTALVRVAGGGYRYFPATGGARHEPYDRAKFPSIYQATLDSLLGWLVTKDEDGLLRLTDTGEEVLAQERPLRQKEGPQ